jgi:hypothetical protein
VESGDSVSARRHSVSVLETLGELSEEGSVAGSLRGLENRGSPRTVCEAASPGGLGRVMNADDARGRR